MKGDGITERRRTADGGVTDNFCCEGGNEGGRVLVPSGDAEETDIKNTKGGRCSVCLSETERGHEAHTDDEARWLNDDKSPQKIHRCGNPRKYACVVAYL